jgi:SAM-dependent methyltransferase
MDKPTRLRSSQAELLAAEAWAEVSDLLDLQLSPLGVHAIEALSPAPGDVVVDVGCGAGQSVLQLAHRVGPEGCVVGIDIAPLLLDIGRRRADGLRQVSFLEADAQAVPLPDQSADSVFSRFGVMAFVDPTAAFSNFRRILKPSGRLAFACWRSLDENELDLLPLRAAGFEELIDPTPFSLADPVFLRAILEAAGFAGITIEPYDELVSSGDLDSMVMVLLRVGPLGRIVRENPELRVVAEPRLRAALAERGGSGAIALRAATWVVTAKS